MRKFRYIGNLIWQIVVGLIVGILLSLIFAWPVKLLWNMCMPYIFKLPQIKFHHAFELMWLSWLLLKSNTLNNETRNRNNDIQSHRAIEDMYNINS